MSDDQNPYERAIATWVERHEDLPAKSVSAVEFKGLTGCDTCGYGEGAALDYAYDDGTKPRSGYLHLENPGRFLEECVQILAEQGVPA